MNTLAALQLKAAPQRLLRRFNWTASVPRGLAHSPGGLAHPPRLPRSGLAALHSGSARTLGVAALQAASAEPLLRCGPVARAVLVRRLSGGPQRPESNARPDAPDVTGVPQIARPPLLPAQRPNRVPEPISEQGSVPPLHNAPLPPRKSLEYHLSRVKTWWGRLAVRTKWTLIRAYRPFNADDLSALFSWIIWGHILWVLLGTTTFISLLIWAVSKARAEDVLARWVGRIVTRETGLRVVFEQAIVPNWKQGAIVLQRVFIQRRPGAVRNVVTGSQAEAARGEPDSAAVDDGNYTQFDLTVDSIAVTLSLKRWLSGRGILETVEAKGIRGVVDRRHLKYDPHYEPTKHRKKHKRGDFDWETTKVDDLMVTVLQPNHQPELPPVPPFQVSVHSCELPRLRKQWLLYDMLNANYFSGSFDNAMLSLHTRQLAGEPATRESSKPAFKKVQRLRIDDVDIHHLNRGVSGMFGWIESGTCDFLADIMLPPDERPLTFREQMQDLLERWDAQLKGLITNKTPQDIVTTVERDMREQELQKAIAIDLRVQFNNPRATAPLYSPDLNYMNNAIVHPIVAYINSRDTYIPVHCHVAKRLYDFDGSWTVYDSGLMGDLSSEIYRAFARNAADDEARSRRIKKVGFWSLQFLAQLVLLTLGIVA